jgi:hypothetical protein
VVKRRLSACHELTMIGSLIGSISFSAASYS